MARGTTQQRYPMTFPHLQSVLAACLVMAFAGAYSEPATAQMPPSPSQLVSATHRYLGSASCAASNCHGGTSLPDSGPKYAAHRIWLSQDVHARAYDVLQEDRSQAMTARLGWRPAHRESRCLACHAVAETPAHPFARTFQVADGVSCEACHGPAEHWLADHSRPQVWSALTDRQKVDLGFQPTEQLDVRAKLCTKCHVGTQDREVNHDMIAAGHPRLAFEFAGYSAIHKKHWNLENDQRQVSGESGTVAAATQLDTQLWLIGQVETIRATLELTRLRAEHPDKPWPEYAEYRCFACHQSLTASGSPKGTTDWANNPALWDVERAGQLPWQPASLGAVGLIEDPQRPQLIGPLRVLRSQISTWNPDRQVILQRANEALKSLEALTDVTRDPAASRRVLNIVGQPENLVERDWEHAMQGYLAVAALSPVSVKRSPEFQEQVTILRESLKFEAGTNSPGQYDVSRGQTIRKALNRLLELCTSAPADTLPPQPTRQP